MGQWRIAEEGHWYDTIEAADADAALAVAREQVDPGAYERCDGALYVAVTVEHAETGERACSTVTFGAPEPVCAAASHDWQSPYELLGGCRENPGVWGKGGGVVIREVCARCGAYRVTDTWAQRRDTGEQGLRDVSYEPADDASMAWIDGLDRGAGRVTERGARNTEGTKS